VVRAKREGESGKCVGVELEDGSVVEADRVIVCLGAGSIRFLEASGADLAVEDRVRSGAVLSACIEGGLDTSKFPQVGCLFQENYEGGGFLPKGPRSPAKIYYDLPVQRWIKHPVSGNRVAVPPPGPLLDMWTAPQAMRDRLRNVAKLFFGDEVGSQLVLTDFRCCWDMYTPSEDFIISPLGLKDSPVGGLYMATGGSFHGFKFLPVIGKYVIDMLEGRLDQKLASKWNWNRDWDHSKRRLAQDAVAVGFEINE
jgi:sarcosine oxidase/L-pipecolate oxidase